MDITKVDADVLFVVDFKNLFLFIMTSDFNSIYNALRVWPNPHTLLWITSGKAPVESVHEPLTVDLNFGTADTTA
jgi:hypothetical protein